MYSNFSVVPDYADAFGHALNVANVEVECDQRNVTRGVDVADCGIYGQVLNVVNVEIDGDRRNVEVGFDRGHVVNCNFGVQGNGDGSETNVVHFENSGGIVNLVDADDNGELIFKY